MDWTIRAHFTFKSCFSSHDGYDSNNTKAEKNIMHENKKQYKQQQQQQREAITSSTIVERARERTTTATKK